ncbi:MAG: Pr6Pr family membrane protein [Bacillota bacterium]|nr:Pr6Pr family membrane protein [Bacillota bacterium]
MKFSKIKFITFYRLLFSVVAWAGIIIMLINNVSGKSGHELTMAIENYFSYFTTESNIMVALILTLSVLYRNAEKPVFLKPQIKGAVTLYITITGIIYHVLLRNVQPPHGIGVYSNLILHYIMPIAFVVDWIIADVRGIYKWKYAMIWLCYPIIYLIFTLIRGSFTLFYPYPFVNVTKLGYGGVAENALVLTVLFSMLGLIYVIIDKISLRLLNSKNNDSEIAIE